MSESSLGDQLREAEASFAAAQWEASLKGFLSVLRAEPRYAPARFRIADALLNLGHRDPAKEVYRGLAWYHIRGGRPLSGLVATKMLLALDPNLDDILEILAELYSSESDRTGDVDPDESSSFNPAVLAPVATEDAEALLEAATREAADTDAVIRIPERLPPIPLFSHLSEEAFLTVLDSMRLRRYGHGEAVIREGEVGDTFFMLAEGEVTVSRGVGEEEVLLARLHKGAVFGEMALVSRAARVATVRAHGDVDALELDRADLEAHAGQLESVKQALRKFTRGRFLANLAATSPLFQPLPRPDRRDLMARFRPQRVFPGDVLIEQGDIGRGLYLVMSGKMKVTAKEDGKVVAVLRSGDVFGEMSLLHDAKTNASVAVEEVGEVLFLPRSDFGEMLATYPSVASTLRAMSQDRLQDRLSDEADVPTDDSSVLL